MFVEFVAAADTDFVALVEIDLEFVVESQFVVVGTSVVDFDAVAAAVVDALYSNNHRHLNKNLQYLHRERQLKFSGISKFKE